MALQRHIASITRCCCCSILIKLAMKPCCHQSYTSQVVQKLKYMSKDLVGNWDRRQIKTNLQFCSSSKQEKSYLFVFLKVKQILPSLVKKTNSLFLLVVLFKMNFFGYITECTMMITHTSYHCACTFD